MVHLLLSPGAPRLPTLFILIGTFVAGFSVVFVFWIFAVSLIAALVSPEYLTTIKYAALKDHPAGTRE